MFQRPSSYRILFLCAIIFLISTKLIKDLKVFLSFFWLTGQLSPYCSFQNPKSFSWLAFAFCSYLSCFLFLSLSLSEHFFGCNSCPVCCIRDILFFCFLLLFFCNFLMMLLKIQVKAESKRAGRKRIRRRSRRRRRSRSWRRKNAMTLHFACLSWHVDEGRRARLLSKLVQVASLSVPLALSHLLSLFIYHFLANIWVKTQRLAQRLL